MCQIIRIRHSDVGQVAVVPCQIESIADDKNVRNFEAKVIG